MERNSRDFESRIKRIDQNAEAICQTLKASPIGKCEVLQTGNLLTDCSERSLLSKI